jgi:hypothetical protein
LRGQIQAEINADNLFEKGDVKKWSHSLEWTGYRQVLNLLFHLNRITAKLKGEKMQTIVINVNNDVLADKVRWLLEHFKSEGLEIVSKGDAYDLKLLRATRNDESVPFDEYLKNENLHP